MAVSMDREGGHDASGRNSVRRTFFIQPQQSHLLRLRNIGMEFGFSSLLSQYKSRSVSEPSIKALLSPERPHYDASVYHSLRAPKSRAELGELARPRNYRSMLEIYNGPLLEKPVDIHAPPLLFQILEAFDSTRIWPQPPRTSLFGDSAANLSSIASNGTPSRASPAPHSNGVPTSPQMEMPQSVTSSDPKVAAQQASDMRNIVRRKLTGYVGFANLPNQWHRKSVRKGFNFNVMVVGKLWSLVPANTWSLTLGQVNLASESPLW